MNKTDITGILTGIELSDAQIKALLDVNSADITKALNKQKDDLTAAKQALTEAQNTIATLEKNKGDVDELQKKIDEYKRADEERQKAAKEAEERAELEGRFAAVTGDRKFIHDMVREGVMRDFGAALKDKSNLGKGDKEIFEALTKDKDYFANQNPPAPPMPQPNPNPNVDVKDRASFLKLSFNDQMKFKTERPDEFKQLFGMPN